MAYTYREIAKMIDHSLLNPALAAPELDAGCLLAKEYDVASVCIVPHYAARAAELLQGASCVTSSTVGFPHGAQLTATKVDEARRLVHVGCKELDMVVNISRVKSGQFAEVSSEISAILEATRAGGAKLKVIFENCYLNEGEKIRLCEICGELGVDWVKTSTGYGTSGSTWEDLALMRKHSPPSVQVKAAGGLRDLDSILRARELGVTRVGSSATKKILDDCRARLGA